MKRILMLVLALVLVMALFTACPAEENPNDDTGTTTVADNGDTTDDTTDETTDETTSFEEKNDGEQDQLHPGA